MGILDFFKPKKKAEEEITPILPEQIYQSGVLELRDVLAPAALKVSPKSLNMGEKIARSYFVISYPRYLTAGWFSPIINLDKMFDVSIFVHPVETGKVLKQFQKKVAEVESQIHMRQEKGFVRDPELQTAYQDLEKLRDELQQAQEKIFDVGLYLTLYGDTEEELEKVESEVKSLMEARLIYMKPALFQQAEGFRSVIPTASDELSVHNKLNSGPLSSIFPFISFDLTSDRGILYGINRHNSSLVLFDRFSLENYNSVVFAKSGAGKSIVGYEPVLVRKDGTVSLRPIGTIVEEAIQKNGAIPIDHELEGVVDPGIEVWGFNSSFKGGWSRVTVAARKDAPKELYRFKTKSGREIETTGDHNMLLLRRGEVVAAKSAEVSVGEYLPLPREIREEKTVAAPFVFNLLEHMRNSGVYIDGAAPCIAEWLPELRGHPVDARLDRYLYQYAAGRRVPLAYFFKILACLKKDSEALPVSALRIISANGTGKLPIHLACTPALAKILGYLVSEGTISKHIAVISNMDPVVIRDACAALAAVGINYFVTEKSVVLSDIIFVKFLATIGMREKSGTKRVPAALFGCEQKTRAAFLAAYFEGDGGVERHAVTAVSKSKALMGDIAYLLLQDGIIARMSRRVKGVAGQLEKHPYHCLTLSGQENLRRFGERIGFVSERKQTLLAQLKRNENTNVDVIPGLAPLFVELDTLLGKALGGTAVCSVLRRGVYNPSPAQLKKAVGEIRAAIAAIQSKRALFEVLARLPRLHDVVQVAEQNPRINRALWNELGSSWATIKRGMGARSANAWSAFTAAGFSVPPPHELKTAISEGFAFLGEEFKAYNPSLRVAVRERPHGNSSYEMLAQGAAFIAARYGLLSRNIPRAEIIVEKLERLASADLAWDEIVAAESFANEKEPYVYDLTVDNENFVAGYGGMFVHNSYMTKLEILRTLMFDTEVIVIDPEKEYEYLAEAVGGKFFSISLTSEHHINPFDLPLPREDESPADVLRSHIISLVGLFRIMLGGLTPEEDALVDRALTETYALKDITPDADFGKTEPPLLSDFETVLGGMEGAESIRTRLTKYTKGTWANFINRPSNVSIKGNLVVFSLRDMEDELKSVATYIVTHHIWSAVRRELRKRLLIVDEAWWMMRSEDTASFLLSVAKRGRKYFLGVATITQDVDDFLSSPYGLPIVTNSSIQMLLKQSPAVIDRIQKVFNLTDEEKYLLLESDVGEGLFFVGLKHVALKIVASYTEDQIITSDPSQLLAIKRAKEELKTTQ